MFLIVFLFITSAQIKNDVDDEFVCEFLCDFSEIWEFFAVWLVFAVWCVCFEFASVFEVFEYEFLKISRTDRVWFDLFSKRSVINFVIFCLSFFSNCWKFSNIVSQYDVFMSIFLFKLIDVNSNFFFIWIWSIMFDVSSVNSRLTRARSIWLISCCTMTCFVVAILISLNRVFCAFFSALSIDKTSVRILIKSCFFLSANWRSSSIFLFRLRKSISSFWLKIDKSIVFVSLWNVSLSNDTSSMFFSIC